MSPTLVLVGIGLALAAFGAVSTLPPQRRERLKRVALVVALVAGLLLLLRAGQPWLAAIGAILLAALRFVGPLLMRLVPTLMDLKRRQPRRDTGEPDFGNGANGTRPTSPARMTRSEAFDVLGLAEGASDDEIRHAHAELIKKVHPDRGGTSYLAARVNLARDLLLPKERRSG